MSFCKKLVYSSTMEPTWKAARRRPALRGASASLSLKAAQAHAIPNLIDTRLNTPTHNKSKAFSTRPNAIRTTDNSNSSWINLWNTNSIAKPEKIQSQMQHRTKCSFENINKTPASVNVKSSCAVRAMKTKCKLDLPTTILWWWELLFDGECCSN